MAFDFAGCGLSEGEYISLGWYERDDVEVAVDWLRKSNKVSTIGIWGRSMGAVTGLMHADRDPSIAGLVLDSPFTSLRTLAEELAKTYSVLFLLNELAECTLFCTQWSNGNG
jgi:alpha/beta superfamily hydrolase